MAYRLNELQSFPLRQEEETETFTKYNKCQDIRTFFFLRKGLKYSVRAQRRESLIVTEEKGRLHGVGHGHLGIQQIFI